MNRARRGAALVDPRLAVDPWKPTSARSQKRMNESHTMFSHLLIHTIGGRIRSEKVQGLG